MAHSGETPVLGRRWGLGGSGVLTAYWLLFMRLLVGWWFLNEGLDKYVTPGPFRAGWFLEKSGTVVSPLLTALANGQSEAVVNVAVPLVEVVIGLGVILGALTRLASLFGASMMLVFYLGNEAWRRGFVNGDLMGLVLFLTILVFGAGRIWGVDAYLEETRFVHTHPWLRYVLG